MTEPLGPPRPGQYLPEINKRVTMNMLIQGSSTHAFLTSHYLVKDELDAIDPSLVPHYDRIAVTAVIGYWLGMP